MAVAGGVPVEDVNAVGAAVVIAFGQAPLPGGEWVYVTGAAGVRLPTRAPGQAGTSYYTNGTSGCDTLFTGWLKPASGGGELAHPAVGAPPKDAKLCFDSTGFDPPGRRLPPQCEATSVISVRSG